MIRDREELRDLVYASLREWEKTWEKQLDLIMEEEKDRLILSPCL